MQHDAAPRVGKVKWFSQDRGYGFLIDEQTGEEIFLHATGFAAQPYDPPGAGMRLSFVLGKSRDGSKPRALWVRSIDG
jgi:cold shock protein